MLYKLSVSNIKKSFKDYAIYFITLIMGVCIFYIFNSMDSQTVMLELSSSQEEMIELLASLLSYVSVFVSVILGFLIIYASRFLIKKRNKEFGIYMTLGMSKRKISLLLLLETFLIGLISLGIGLLLGIALSQITSIFVANMFEVNMTKFSFNFSKSAMIKTIIYYGIIYLVVMIFNTIIINKNKLINLLQVSKKQEKIKLKNPYVCIVLFILSIGMLGSAYYMVTDGLFKLLDYGMNILLLPISLGVVGTILFFYSISGMLLKILSKWHNIYYKKLNTFVFKQISSKINSMVISISVICIMLFITLCLLSSAFTIKNYFNNSINKYAPVDFQGVISTNADKEEVINSINSEKLIKDNVKDMVIINEYYDNNLLYRESLGNYYPIIKDKFPYLRYDFLVEIVGESDYNKLAKLYNLDKVSLKDDEYIIVSNYDKKLYDEVLDRDSIINIFGYDLKPASKRCIEGFVRIGGNPSNLGFFVVPDKVINKEDASITMLVGNYRTKDEDIVKLIEDKFSEYNRSNTITIDTKNDIKESSTGLSAIVTFIGLYLGIIFLISSSAILALKELSDSLDDKNKYQVLRQIGADEVDINKSLFKQMLIFFVMPLSLAIVHTLFGLRFCTYVLGSLGIDSILKGSVTTFIFLIIIYSIYFIFTYICSKNIIKERM